jgi:colicin import membrane protein
MILERPEEPGKKYAMTFTFMVHAGLIAALFFGVQWKRSKPEVMEVELWSSRPVPAVQFAEPPPPPPEPVVKPEPKPEPKPIPKVEPEPPRKPDIAIKEEKKKAKLEPKELPPPKPETKKPVEPIVKLPPVDPFKDALERDEKQRKATERQNKLRDELDKEQRAAGDNRSMKAWGDKISHHVRQYVMLPANIQGNPQAIFQLRVLPSGDVLQPIQLKKSSGNSALDAAVERAIIKASPLPKPDNGTFPNPLEIKYKPEE